MTHLADMNPMPPLARRLAAAIVLAVALAAPAARAAPEAELWQRWTAHDPDSQRTVDHAPWNAFLATYVTPHEEGANRVDYEAVTPADRERLSTYIRGLGEIQVSRLGRPEQLAYWINLYNAVTVRTVLDHLPVDSIRDIDISPGLFADGPWGAKLVTVEGEELSLDDIEHRILRPIWQDPRIHYAVNCAALGCPDLIPRAYRAADIETVLSDNARAFINDPRGVRMADGDLVASSIYKWFRDDFGGDDEGVIAHLLQYAQGGIRATLETAEDIDGYAYDWSLNGISAP